MIKRRVGVNREEPCVVETRLPPVFHFYKGHFMKDYIPLPKNLAGKAAEALFKRALGYEVTEVTTKTIGDRVEVIETTKHVPADVEAAIYLLHKYDPEYFPLPGMGSHAR